MPLPSATIRADKRLYQAGRPFTQDGITYVRTHAGVEQLLRRHVRDGSLTMDYRSLLTAMQSLGYPAPDPDSDVHLNLLFSWMQRETAESGEAQSPQAVINGILRSYLSRQRVEGAESAIQSIADNVFSVSYGDLDFYELAKAVSAGVTKHLLELPANANDVIRDELTRYETLSGFDWVHPAPKEFVDALDNLFDTHSKGLVRSLNQAHASKVISKQQRNAILWGAYAAGYGSTAAAICLLVGHIVEFGLQTAVVEHRDDTPWLMGLINESLRFGTVMPTIPAVATRGFTIDRVQVRAGQLVYPTLSAANMDKKVFGDDAGSFDPERDATQHLSFSSGMHTCLGAALSRLEMIAVLRSLVDYNLFPYLNISRWERQEGLVDTVKTAVFEVA